MKINKKVLKLMRASGKLLKQQQADAATVIKENLDKNYPNFNPFGFNPGSIMQDLFAGMMAAPQSEAVQDPQAPGKFISGSLTNHAGTRHYKLYIPSAYTGQSLPLVVMLHGCGQDPDDFAAGTEMNRHAEERPCFVLYPAQSRSANAAGCWNWFETANQQRDQGEASIIADMTRQVMKTYAINPAKVFVAGLSAGGSMAIIMGTAYPELYVAVGIHSGLPYAAAQDLSSAMEAMQNGANNTEISGAVHKPTDLDGVPVIVFHGDADTTVNPRNSQQIILQSTGLTEEMMCKQAARPTVEQGSVPHGHAYTRTVHHDLDGAAIAEEWLVHGAGHAWSGGNTRGSYTDDKGPNATREMIRFFATRAADNNKR